MKIFRKIFLVIVLLGGVFYCIAQWDDWLSANQSGAWCTLLVDKGYSADSLQILAYVDTLVTDTTGSYEMIHIQDSSYIIDYPNVRIIVLKTHQLNLLSDFTINQTFLKRSLLTAGDRWKVVCMHRSVYSASMMHSHAMVYGAFRLTLNDADLIIAGDDHTYARRAMVKMNNQLKTPVFLVSNASSEHNVPKLDIDDQCVGSNHSFYEKILITPDSLFVYSHFWNDSLAIPFTSYRVPDKVTIDSVISALSLSSSPYMVDSISRAMASAFDTVRFSTLYDAFSIAGDTRIVYEEENLPNEIIELPELAETDSTSEFLSRLNERLHNSRARRYTYRRKDRIKE
ncbi:MAG: hypothetical protein MJZ89_04750 [Paludibacteraceae bacterium]|nr:hypothetical protein [Paludibacteraceae bacterium]